MKVAFVLGTSAGGTGRHVKMLAAGCAAQGTPVEVFGPAPTDRAFGFTTGDPPPPASASATAPSPPSTPASPPIPPLGSQAPSIRFAAVDIADRPRVLPDLRAIARLRRLIEAGRPDLVHAHGLRAGALTAIALAFAQRRTGVHPALVVTVHNAPPEGALTGAIYRVLELIVARNAASVLCVSPDLEDRMRAAGAQRLGRAVVPPPAIPLTAPSAAAVSLTALPPPAAASQARDVSAETPAAAVPLTASPPPAAASQPGDVSAETRAAPRAVPRGPVVLAVGRLAAQKGFGTLIEAAARWRDIRPEPVLVIVGEGPLEAELKQQAAALGLTVEFAGPRTDVPGLLAGAAVFVLPSLWEGQALVLQEAMRAGVPIVATSVGGTPALVREDAAVLIPPGDPERLAAAVRAVLTDPALAARLRAAAARQAQGLPSEADALAAALAEYDYVTGGRGAFRA
jgi:glycosyltransferase involved in cell wall biosynthesis